MRVNKLSLTLRKAEIYKRLKVKMRRDRVENLMLEARARKRNVSWLVNQKYRERLQTLRTRIQTSSFDSIELAFKRVWHACMCVWTSNGLFIDYCVGSYKGHVLISAEGCKWERYATSINLTIPFSTTVHLNLCTEEWVEAEKWSVRNMTKRRGCRYALSELPKHRHHIQGYSVAQKLFHSIILQEQTSLLEGICGLVHDYLFYGKSLIKVSMYTDVHFRQLLS